MVRFFDLTADPGKLYRYRVKVLLEDPNRPRDPKAAPAVRTLDAEARKRVEEVEAQDAEYNKDARRPKRTYFRKTDWSEPSNIVTIPQPNGGTEPIRNTTERDMFRTWTDSSGKYTVVAQFMGVAFDNVKLKKKDGGEITLPLEKLSEVDQAFIRERKWLKKKP